MSQVHNEDIKDLLSYFQVIPDALMKVYLMKQYNMTPNRAVETIYNACRTSGRQRPAAYVTKGGLARSESFTANSQTLQRCRAFRVCCEFLPSSRQFVLPKIHPWLINFHEEGMAYYVCEFRRGEELLMADMIRNAGISREMMNRTVRIAIMAPGANRSLVDECGIKYFCTVNDEYDLDVTEAVDDAEVWNGVPIVD